ncbi:hypothetical protein D9M68_643510 [compost metagenome]
MRTHLSERASKELIEIMNHYGYASTNHTLNVLVSSLHKSLFKNPNYEVSINESGSTPEQQ